MISVIWNRILHFFKWNFSILTKIVFFIKLKKIDKELIPDFFCIGAQKAGTSWLYSMLRIQKELFIPSNRYIHFFDRNFHKSLTNYLNIFEGGRNKIKGEVIPGYGLIPRIRIRFIHWMNPKLKIILILRDPIDRAWSHAKMALTADGKSIDDISDRQFIKHFHSSLSTSKGDYEKIYNNWMSVFPIDQIHIIFNEDIKNSPLITLQQVFGFLDIRRVINKDEYDLKKQVNKGINIKIPTKFKIELLSIYKDKMNRYPELFGPKAEKWMSKYVNTHEKS